jgi:haloacetate dehalogenase
MTEKTGIERRTLLRAITAASGTALSSALAAQDVAAQSASRAAAAGSGHFETAEIKTGDNTIFIRVCPGTSSGITKFSEHEAD